MSKIRKDRAVEPRRAIPIKYLRRHPLYGFAFTLAIIALISAVLGFGGVAGSLANIAIIIFVIALIGTIIFFLLGWKAAKNIIS